MHFFIEKSTDFWWKMGPRGSPKGPQRDPKIEELGGRFAPSPQDPPKGVKWIQNDSKMEPKWSPNGVKMEPKTNEKRVKHQVEIFAFFENSYQVSTRVFNDFTNLFYEISATCCRNSWGLSLKFLKKSYGIGGEVLWESAGDSLELMGNKCGCCGEFVFIVWGSVRN